MKYLSVIFNWRLTFAEHARYAAGKALVCAAALGRILSQIGDVKRKLLREMT